MNRPNPIRRPAAPSPVAKRQGAAASVGEKSQGILQINTRGAWAHLCRVDLHSHDHEALRAARAVAHHLDAKAKFRIVALDGRNVICPWLALQALLQVIDETAGARP